MMRWKILEAAQNHSSIEEVLSYFQKTSSYAIEEETVLEILRLYCDSLPENIQKEISCR